MSDEIVIADTYRTRPELPTVHVPAEGNTMMAMLANAVNKGMSVETIRELRAIQKEYEADQARKAFMVAMSEFKANPPKVVKDMENKQFNSRYATIEAWLPVIEELGKHGISSSYEYSITPDKRERVTCILTHTLGHSERASAEGLPDTSGKKNPLQEMKSTRTYLRIETLAAVTGLTASGTNDDGNGAGFRMGDVMDESKLCDFLAAIETASNKAEVGKVYLIAIQEASHLKDQEAMDRLNAKKDAALAKLSEKK